MASPTPQRPARRAHFTFAAAALALAVAVACAIQDPRATSVQGWWDGFGPVIPHEEFPADCSLCHVSESWSQVREDFAYDHEAATGHALLGAHQDAQCLQCHNDRGPVQVFAARGCAGCHEDVHLGQLGSACQDCHSQNDWRPEGQIAAHDRTRFPLYGAHAATTCYRCHPGAEVGVFRPTDTECVSCHSADLLRATSPDHLGMGWTSSCDRCHVPTSWREASFNHPFFPLSGDHGGLSCTDCHRNPSSFAGFSCINCHAHRQGDMADAHEDVSGYVYESGACLACHPRGTK